MRPWRSRAAAPEIQERLATEVGEASLARFHSHVKEMPQYRFVDAYRATETVAERLGSQIILESDHRAELLGTILAREAPRWISRRMSRADRIAWPVGPGQEAFFPVDVFRICRDRERGGAPAILRVHYDANNEKTCVEAASADAAKAEESAAEIARLADAKSIYRNRVVALRFDTVTRDEFGDIERPARLRVLFAPEPSPGDSEIVMDEPVRRTLWRNVVDLHRRRDVLKAHGVPVRRGVLLHGPPGTGKTFACRWLCANLPAATRIIVAGSALHEIAPIFSLARLLQPSVVFLEDVDLVFTARDVSHQGSILGELLDQMDGLRPHEDVGFVLTTNAIDRIEGAIKDRPGRISQCVHMGPPGPDLRRRYLQHYLKRYEPHAADLEALVARSKGATQAFLKDWVHRAVQIASERSGVEQALPLRTADFDEALAEMRASGSGTTARLIGFLESDES